MLPSCSLTILHIPSTSRSDGCVFKPHLKSECFPSPLLPLWTSHHCVHRRLLRVAHLTQEKPEVLCDFVFYSVLIYSFSLIALYQMCCSPLGLWYLLLPLPIVLRPGVLGVHIAFSCLVDADSNAALSERFSITTLCEVTASIFSLY